MDININITSFYCFFFSWAAAMKQSKGHGKFRNEVHDYCNDDISCYSMSSGTCEMASVNEPNKNEEIILKKAGKVVQKPFEIKKAVENRTMPVKVDKPVTCDVQMLKKYKKLKMEAEKGFEKVEIGTPQPLTSSQISNIVTQSFEEFIKKSGGGNAMKINFNNKKSEIDIYMVKTDTMRAKHGGRLTRDALEQELAMTTISEEKLIKLECNKIARDLKVIAKPEAAVRNLKLMEYPRAEGRLSENGVDFGKNVGKRWYRCSIM